MISKAQIASLVVGARVRWIAGEFTREVQIERIPERGTDGKGRLFARVLSGSLALKVVESDPSFEVLP